MTVRQGTKRIILRAIDYSKWSGEFAEFTTLQEASQTVVMVAQVVAKVPWPKVEFYAAIEWAASELSSDFPTETGCE